MTAHASVQVDPKRRFVARTIVSSMPRKRRAREGTADQQSAGAGGVGAGQRMRRHT